MPPQSEAPVIIVGAGVAGLACALDLVAAGVPVQVLEGSDAVGGRMRTDERDGFRLDPGVQVFNTAYPQATRPERCCRRVTADCGSRIRPGSRRGWWICCRDGWVARPTC